jgi:hypothetical protein
MRGVANAAFRVAKDEIEHPPTTGKWAGRGRGLQAFGSNGNPT